MSDSHSLLWDDTAHQSRKEATCQDRQSPCGNLLNNHFFLICEKNLPLIFVFILESLR